MEPTPAEEAFIAQASQKPARSFDNLPLNIQQWLFQERQKKIASN